MTILTSISEPIRFTPSYRSGDEAPVFLLRAGSVVERGRLEAELAGEHQAGRVFPYELLEAFQSGVQALMADDPGRDEIAALAIAEGEGETLTGTDRQLLVEAREILTKHWPEYRALVAQAQRRRELAPILALQRFCVGWEKVAAPFARGRDGLVTEAALAALDPFDLMLAGNEAYGLLYGRGQEGNSSPASVSDSGPATSGSDDTSPADGTSAA